MDIMFKRMLSSLDYDCLKAELSYLEENYNVKYTLKLDRLTVECKDFDILMLIKDTLKLFYGCYLK
jgi:hypothetical protein